MAADYLISSLPPLAFDVPPSITVEAFDAMSVQELGAPAPQALPKAAAEWADLKAQILNAIAAERAKARGADPTRYARPVEGCSIFWRTRAQAAMQEKDPVKRDAMIDRILWDAAGELVPASSPLSAAAALTYRIRLEIASRRAKISTEDGNSVFNTLVAAAEDAAGTKE